MTYFSDAPAELIPLAEATALRLLVRSAWAERDAAGQDADAR